MLSQTWAKICFCLYFTELYPIFANIFSCWKLNPFKHPSWKRGTRNIKISASEQNSKDCIQLTLSFLLQALSLFTVKLFCNTRTGHVAVSSFLLIFLCCPSSHVVRWSARIEIDVWCNRDDYYPVCRLDIRLDSEFATG